MGIIVSRCFNGDADRCSGRVRPVPGVESPDALLLADPEERVEHAPVAHLCVLGLTLDLEAGLRQVDGKRPCRKSQGSNRPNRDKACFL